MLGMHFRIVGDQAVFTDMDESFGTIAAKWSENLIAWAIYPFAARGQWGESNSQFFDFGQATWTIINQMFSGAAPWNFAEAAKVLPHPAPNASVADQGNDGQEENSDSKRGSGHVVINGEPRAKPSMTLELIGARPGVRWHVQHHRGRSPLFAPGLHHAARGQPAAFLRRWGKPVHAARTWRADVAAATAAYSGAL
jgi:hypothetical protein